MIKLPNGLVKNKELIENFLDNRSFRIPVEDLDIARNALGLLINSVKEECAKECNPYIESNNAFIKGTAKGIANAIKDSKE